MAGEAYLAWPRQHISGFLKRHNVKSTCFVAYAGISLCKESLKASYDIYTRRVAEVFQSMGIEVRSIHESKNPVKTLQEAEAIMVGLIPFQINPHYLDTNPAGHGGETRQQRIEEFLSVNRNITVAGLREG